MDNNVHRIHDRIHHLGNEGIVSRPLPDVGEQVTVHGVRGVYWVRSIREETKLGTIVTLWGGDKNPLGNRCFRSFTADRIRRIPVKKKRGTTKR